MALPLFLTILKVIGLIFICILCVILFIVLTFLFVPFSYKINVEKYNKINGAAVISWLFGIIRVIYEADASGDSNMSVRIIGLRVWSDKKADKAAEEEKTAWDSGTSGESKPNSPNLKNKEDSGGRNADNRHAENAEYENKQEKRTEPHKQEKQDEHQKEARRAASKMKKKTKENKSKERGAFERFKKIWDYENKSEILNQVILLLKRFFRAVMNFKVWAELKVGTGQPHTTGYVLALCGMASGFQRISINAEADFEEASLLGNVLVKGRLFICSIVWAIILFVFNKNIFPIIKKLIFKKG